MTIVGSAIRGLIWGLERVGIDARGAIRRFREAVVRPYVAEFNKTQDSGDRVRLLEGDLSDLRLRLDQAVALTAALSAETKDLRSNLDREAAARRLTERLLTQVPAARPPGSMHAVAALGNPAVSVIIPTRNRPEFVAEAISSVQGQSFSNWELVVVDDGGTKENTEAVAPFLADRRIRHVMQPSSGSASARNRGINETSAPFIAYLDDDNVWYPDFLARAVDVLATNPDVDLVYGALVSAYHRSVGIEVLLTPFDRKLLLEGNFIDTSVILHRRSLVAKFGGWDTELQTLRDWDLVLRYTQEKPALGIEVLGVYYRDCDGKRMSVVIPQAAAHAKIRAKWVAHDN